MADWEDAKHTFTSGKPRRRHHGGDDQATLEMAVPTGMLGDGFYNRNSAPQWASIEVVLPWLEESIAEMPLADFVPAAGLVDFGCSEGANSIRVMQRLIRLIRQRDSRPILTVHSDLPTNDYRSLLGSLRGDGRSTFGDDVFSALVGGSMFEQLLPPSSVHVATTFNAIGFLRRRPVAKLPGYILPNGPSAQRNVGEVRPEDRLICAAQAHSDLESFLYARAAELVPGGKLLIEVFGSGETCRTCDGIYDALNDAVLEALADGLIDAAGYDAYYQPVYFRTLDELTAPLAAPNGALARLFRLDRAETYEVPVPFVEAFRRTGDAAAFARAYTDFFRAFTEPVLRAAFPGAPDLADGVYQRAERLIHANPERYPFRYIAVAALMTRRES